MKKKILIIIVVLICLFSSIVFASSTYTVKKGDTMSKIAFENDISLGELVGANPGIKNPSLIFIGQKITIPDSASQKLVKYTVQRGDTMYGIARKYEISLTELLKANSQISSPSAIYVGQIITIPDASPLSSHEKEVIVLVNKERAARGLAPLATSTKLSSVARVKSQDMIDNKYFSHTSPVYGSPFKMMERFGLRFSAAGENIAYGQKTAGEVVNGWMNSPGHRANILSNAFTHIGVGAAKMSNGTLYWTQMFMKPY
jgi:uncharacterized YkwD family protein